MTTSDHVGRLPFAFEIALLAGIEAGILSLPWASYVASSRAPKSEFAGLAVIGSMIGTSCVAGASAMVLAFAIALTLYHGDSPVTRGIRRALVSSIAAGAIGTVTLGFFSNGLLWAIWLSGAVLIGGMVRLFFLED